MGFLYSLIAAGLVLALFWMGTRLVAGGSTRDGGRERVRLGRKEGTNDPPRRDLNANINPSQTGNQLDLFPDRTGARTRRELGARDATDVTFAGNRDEGATVRLEEGATVRREVKPGSHVSESGSQSGELAPEDEFGEDRPVSRTQAPDQPPTQWHPRDHGVPGDHYRDGHHRSATAPEKITSATDPYAHAPFPGPNHVPPESGQTLPPERRP